MKIVISESQLNELITGEFDEIKTVQKSRLGSGAFHMIYPSKKYPNIVYKIGEHRVVDRWFDVFSENPELFPKVYKRGKMNVKSFNGETFEVSYVAIERLNTKKSEDEWDIIDNFCRKEIGESFDSLVVDFENSDTDIRYVFHLMRDQNEIELSEIYQNYIMLVNVILEIFPRADLHKNQFGYDNNGVLKCLDI